MLRMRNGTSQSPFRLSLGDNPGAPVRPAPGHGCVTTGPQGGGRTSPWLLISQVPIRRYEKQDYRCNRLFFPERNVTMSALTTATMIVEAGETSGTLIQARAALQQGRKLFILDSCFKNKGLTWPHSFASKGAIRVTDYDDIKVHLSAPADTG